MSSLTKFLHKFKSIINPTKSKYSFATENTTFSNSGVANDSTSLVELIQMFQKVCELRFSKKETIDQSQKSLSTTSSNIYIKANRVVTEQKIHKRNGIELFNSKSIKGEEHEAMLMFKSTNDNISAPVGKKVGQLVSENIETKVTITSQAKLVYYQSLINGERKAPSFKEISRQDSQENYTINTVTNDDVPEIGAIEAVTHF